MRDGVHGMSNHVTRRSHDWLGAVTRATIVCALAASSALLACRPAPSAPQQRAFATPEEAVDALRGAAEAGNIEDLIAIFGPDGRELIASSDPATARANREVFVVAVGERWHLATAETGGRLLVIGNEEWPFPVPIVQGENGWRFDTAAGKEEVASRRIGRNELSAIRVCRTYRAAQRLYAQHGHDGKPPGLYARTFQSDPGRQNGLYWPAVRGQKRSPLGDLIAQATNDRQAASFDGREPAPFHGYYYRILTAQGPAAPGGARDYIVDGEMSGGFGLVAWPAQYDVTGVMTFVINHDGVVWEKDLGPGTEAAAAALTAYDPDGSWAAIESR